MLKCRDSQSQDILTLYCSKNRSSRCGAAEMSLTRNHEVASLIPGLDRWVQYLVALSCGVGRRRGSDLALLWLWHRLAATATIGPVAWEPPYGAGVALERQKKKKLLQILALLLCATVVRTAMTLRLQRSS